MRILDKIILDKIIELLNEQEKKQKELTDYLGISKNVFTDWKSGKNTSYKKYLNQIAEFFGVTVDYLLGRTSFAENDFTPTEIQLISNYRELNADNREKTSDYINDLLENQKYREKETQDEIVTLQKLLEEYDAQEYAPVYTAASDGKPPKATMLTKEQRLKILEILNDK